MSFVYKEIKHFLTYTPHKTEKKPGNSGLFLLLLSLRVLLKISLSVAAGIIRRVQATPSLLTHSPDCCCDTRDAWP